MNTHWTEFLTGQGAQITHDRVLHFGNAATELQTTAKGNIITDLSHLGLLEINGTDAANFLQGQLTNDVKLLSGSHSQYAGYCNAKGRLLALFLAFAHGDHFHLQLNGGLTEAILKRLKIYVLRAKVQLADVTDSIIRIGVSGPETPQLLGGWFAQVPGEAHQLVTLENGTLIRLPGAMPRYIVYTQPDHARHLWQKLTPHCQAAGADCWDWLEIQAGIPDITPATQEQFVPQMVNLDLLGGISFKKGCYTGQEIVARSHYLGKIKRRTCLAHAAEGGRPVPGNPVYGVDSAEPVGQVVLAAPAPSGGYDLLIEVRQESISAGPIRLIAPDGPLLAWTSLAEPAA